MTHTLKSPKSSRLWNHWRYRLPHLQRMPRSGVASSMDNPLFSLIIFPAINLHSYVKLAKGCKGVDNYWGQGKLFNGG